MQVWTVLGGLQLDLTTLRSLILGAHTEGLVSCYNWEVPDFAQELSVVHTHAGISLSRAATMSSACLSGPLDHVWVKICPRVCGAACGNRDMLAHG